ncbi:MAG TPA: Hsp20/alpha crystallin family protein [Candidatus Avimuribaculum pullicola]|nr:Hsp20/alpha crystallin family protein [Candidatus Avimuribaculum pullicola]
MALIRRNQNWLPSVFNDLFDNNDWIERTHAITSPAINVIERENEYSVEIAAPGMTKDDFNLHLDEEGNLVVSLEKKEENKEENKKNGHFLRREFSYSQFRQVMILPDDVDRDKISARVENGVLTIDLLKKSQEPAKEAKKIEIK